MTMIRWGGMACFQGLASVERLRSGGGSPAGDQPFWGAACCWRGVAPHPIAIDKLTEDKLKAALDVTQQPDVRCANCPYHVSIIVVVPVAIVTSSEQLGTLSNACVAHDLSATSIAPVPLFACQGSLNWIGCYCCLEQVLPTAIASPAPYLDSCRSGLGSMSVSSSTFG